MAFSIGSMRLSGRSFGSVTSGIVIDIAIIDVGRSSEWRMRPVSEDDEVVGQQARHRFVGVTEEHDLHLGVQVLHGHDRVRLA